MLEFIITPVLRYVSQHTWPAVAWTLLILIICLIPSSEVPGSTIRIPGLDKLVHLGIFGVWTFLWLCAREEHATLIILSGIGLGLGIEFLQEISEMGRSFEWWDFGADTAGVLAGYIFKTYLLPLVLPVDQMKESEKTTA
jgi:hypothetical protein